MKLSRYTGIQTCPTKSASQPTLENAGGTHVSEIFNAAKSRTGPVKYFLYFTELPKVMMIVKSGAKIK